MAGSLTAASRTPSGRITLDGETARRGRQSKDGELWAAAGDAVRYKHTWQRGDVLIIDNMKVMHGRQPYTGDRQLGVVLAFPQKRA